MERGTLELKNKRELLKLIHPIVAYLGYMDSDHAFSRRVVGYLYGSITLGHAIELAARGER